MIDKDLSTRMGVRSCREVLLGLSRGIDDTVRLIEDRLRVCGEPDRRFLSGIRNHLDYLNGDYVSHAMISGGYPDAPYITSVQSNSKRILGGRYGESCMIFGEDLGGIRFHRGHDDFEYDSNGTWKPVPIISVDGINRNA